MRAALDCISALMVGGSVGVLGFLVGRMKRRMDEYEDRSLETAKRMVDLWEFQKLTVDRLDAHAEWIRFTDKALRLSGPVEKEPARG